MYNHVNFVSLLYSHLFIYPQLNKFIVYGLLGICHNSNFKTNELLLVPVNYYINPKYNDKTTIKTINMINNLESGCIEKILRVFV